MASALLSVAFLVMVCGVFCRGGSSGGAVHEEDRPALSSLSEELLKGATDEFATDFSRHSVPYLTRPTALKVPKAAPQAAETMT